MSVRIILTAMKKVMNTPWDPTSLQPTSYSLQPTFGHGLGLGRSLGLQATHCWFVLVAHMEHHPWGCHVCLAGLSRVSLLVVALPIHLHCRFDGQSMLASLKYGRGSNSCAIPREFIFAMASLLVGLDLRDSEKWTKLGMSLQDVALD